MQGLFDIPAQEEFLIQSTKKYYFEDALLKYSIGDYQGAKKELLEIQKSTKNPDSFYLLALTEYHLNEFSKSIEYFSKFIELRSSIIKNGYCYLNRGKCFLLLEENIKAKGDFIKAIDVLPTNNDSTFYAHFYLAIAETYLENYNMAIADLNIAIANLLRFSKPFIWRAYCNLMLGNLKEAQEDIKKAIILGEDDLIDLINDYGEAKGL